MTAPSQQIDLLTREELDAILAELAEGRAQGALPMGGPFRRRPAQRKPQTVVRMPELRTATGQGLEAWGKLLASRHQRTIDADLFGWDEIEIEEFAETLISTDLVALFHIEPFDATGFVLMARPLVFGLLTCEFGGRRHSSDLPERPYSRIEQGFLRRTATELVGALLPFWSSQQPLEVNVTDLVGREALRERLSETVMLASIDLSGLAPVSRLRIGFPKAPFSFTGPRAPAHRTAPDPELERTLGEIDVSIQIEIGSTELSLAQLGSLQAGDALFLSPSSPDGFLVRIAGVPKFRATRGSVGGRLAVQVLERISTGQVRDE